MKKLLTITAIFGIGICISCDGLTDGPDKDNTDQENTELPENSGNTETPGNSENNDSEQGENTVNPLVGTAWEWSEDPITWTFTFTENEVIFDYKAVFSPSDISTSQYKSTYTYTAPDTIEFDMTVWSDIVWQCIGKISNDTIELSSKGTEAWDIALNKK